MQFAANVFVMKDPEVLLFLCVMLCVSPCVLLLPYFTLLGYGILSYCTVLIIEESLS